jgi:hypothetical protein
MPTNYNTMGGTGPKKAPEPKFHQNRPWEFRGTICGLLIDVGSRTASQVMMLIPMVGSVLLGEGAGLRCSEKVYPKSLAPDGAWMVYVCEYLSAFSKAYPVLAATAVMLITGRNLLQKRLYYGMLQSGGVVTFGQNNPLKDILFWFLVASYGHCVAYLGLICFVFNKDGELYFHETGKLEDGTLKSELKMGDEELQMILQVCTLLLIPGAFFLIFFYGGYDIEGTLVPLSQYIHDAKDVAADKEDAKKSLSQLRMLSDSITKVVLEDFEDQIFATAGDYEGKCMEVKKMSLRAEEEYVKEDLPQIPLFESMWPGQLLLKPDIKGDLADNFKLLWTILMPVFLILIGVLCTYMASHIWTDIYELWTDYLANYKVIPHMLVFIVHFVVVIVFCRPFIQTIQWRFKRSPLMDAAETTGLNA